MESDRISSVSDGEPWNAMEFCGVLQGDSWKLPRHFPWKLPPKQNFHGVPWSSMNFEFHGFANKYYCAPPGAAVCCGSYLPGEVTTYNLQCSSTDDGWRHTAVFSTAGGMPMTAGSRPSRATGPDLFLAKWPPSCALRSRERARDG